MSWYHGTPTPYAAPCARGLRWMHGYVGWFIKQTVSSQTCITSSLSTIVANRQATDATEWDSELDSTIVYSVPSRRWAVSTCPKLRQLHFELAPG
jgi:hypothetical protein